MTKKFGEARRNAFLGALAATGNQTLAAERARVSRSWVQLHRSTDAEFDAACRAAIAEAKACFDRLRTSGEGAGRPPSGWGHLDGEELVVRSTGGTPASSPELSRGRGRPQIARARLRQWSPRVEARFLAALMATCNVKAACAEVSLTAASAYNHRKRWPGFARRWDEAVEIGYCQIEAGLLEAGINLLSGEDLPDPPALRGMTVGHAIHVLHMHKHAVRGIGGAPGKRWQRPKTLEELTPGILEKLSVLLPLDPDDAADLAARQKEWARRRQT